MINYPGFTPIGYDLGNSYTQGSVPHEFIEKLKRVEDQIIRWGSRGVEFCEMCCPKKPMKWAQFVSTDKNNRYIWPELLSHYIEKHNYLPPQPFIEWIMKF